MIESLSGNGAYHFFAQCTKENRRLVAVVVAGAVALAAVALVFRKLQQGLPFDAWAVKLGMQTRPSLSETDAKDISVLHQTHSPGVLASRLFGTQNSTAASSAPAVLTKESTPQECFEWFCAHRADRKALLLEVNAVLPPYRESALLPTEEERAIAAQSWAASLKQGAILLGLTSFEISGNIFQAVQSYPRLAYTMVFNCVAPLVAEKFLEAMKDILPEKIQDMGNFYLEHRGKFALAALGLMAGLYLRMRQEKGILTNLTENFASLRYPHRGIDQIPSYSRPLDELLCRLGSDSAIGSANVIWYSQRQAHRTFQGELGLIVAEMTAAGRVYDSSRTPIKYPNLKHMRVFELDLSEFLVGHHSAENVYQSWHETIRYMRKNDVLILKNIEVLSSHFIKPPVQTGNPEGGRGGGYFGPQDTPEKALYNCIKSSLKNRTLRCIVEIDESEILHIDPEIKALFSLIQAPNITPKELEELCQQLYASTSNSYSVPKQAVQELFRLMGSTLKTIPLPPKEILEAIQEVLRENDLQARGNQAIEQAEHRFREAVRLNGQLLQQLWQTRIRQADAPDALLGGIFLLERVVLPLYAKAVVEKKIQGDYTELLLSKVKKQFKRLFGPCTEEERKRLLELPVKLQDTIKGNTAGIRTIYEALYAWRKVPPIDRRPLVLFFAGPPGSGKSETATQLAHHLNDVYGITEAVTSAPEPNVLRINLNRAKQGGIWGGDKVPNLILSQILKTPTSVIILEEWDKMEEGEKSSLLELLEGSPTCFRPPWAYSSENSQYVDKSCATFILTANVAAEELKESEVLGFADDVELIKRCIPSYFPEHPERAGAFLSRLGAVISFRGISAVGVEAMIEKYLEEYIVQGIVTEANRATLQTNIMQECDRAKVTDGREVQRIVTHMIAAQSEK